MAQHFLTKTDVELGQCLEFADGLALDAYPALHQILLSRAGPEAAALFAEPLISRGNDQAQSTVSWYADVEGEGQPLSRLDGDAQAALEAELSRILLPMRGLVDGPDDGALVAAALHIRDRADVWSVNGRPVIINWGILPEGLARDPSKRSAHYQRTLGRFLPLEGAPPLTSEERQKRRSLQASAAPETPSQSSSPAVASGAIAAGAAGGAAMASQSRTADHEKDAERSRVPLGAWLPLACLLLLAAGTLAWLLIPGNRIFPERPQVVVTDEAALAAAEGVNRSLEERLVRLQTALDGAVCEADGTLLMPDGYTIEGLLPPDPNDPTDRPGAVREASASPVLAPDPERVQVPAVAGREDPETLLAHVEARTAMVLAKVPNGLATGSGFFVGPDLLVTNHHVIESAVGGEIYVTNRALGSVHAATVLKSSGPISQTGSDLALLRVEGVDQPAFTILQSDTSLRLQPVITAGYPGDILDTDADYQALTQGNSRAVPELVVTDGTISAEQSMSPQTNVVVHSAPISTGNSGGPLIDMCGRLVGVNTFGRQAEFRNLNFALSSGDLMRFLEGGAALPQVNSQPCQPLLARPEAPQAEAALDASETTQIPPLDLGQE